MKKVIILFLFVALTANISACQSAAQRVATTTTSEAAADAATESSANTTDAETSSIAEATEDTVATETTISIETTIPPTTATTETHPPIETSTATDTIQTTVESTHEYDIANDIEFADLAGIKFYFSSGAGGWHTELTIQHDGSFSGYYTDSEMGDTSTDYPNGTNYYCSFTGLFSELKKKGDNEYSMKCEILTQKGMSGDNSDVIIDGVKYIASPPHGLYNTDEILLYLPGKKIRELPEEFLHWVHVVPDPEAKDDVTLNFYGLYNENEQQGFSGWEE